MNIAENILNMKAILKELEILVADSSCINRDALFEPYTRMNAEVGQGLIEADRLGNTPSKDAVGLVKEWFADYRWESNL